MLTRILLMCSPSFPSCAVATAELQTQGLAQTIAESQQIFRARGSAMKPARFHSKSGLEISNGTRCASVVKP